MPVFSTSIQKHEIHNPGNPAVVSDVVTGPRGKPC